MHKRSKVALKIQKLFSQASLFRHRLHSHTSGSGAGDTTQVTWNQLWQVSQQTILSSYSSGILQMQYSLILWRVRLGRGNISVRVEPCGNELKILVYKHFSRCALIASCLYCTFSGFVPKHTSTALAMAKTPQSKWPDCCCTDSDSMFKMDRLDETVWA